MLLLLLLSLFLGGKREFPLHWPEDTRGQGVNTILISQVYVCGGGKSTPQCY